MLVNFLETDRLKARSVLILSKLEEYSSIETSRFDEKQYSKWEARVSEAIKLIGDGSPPEPTDAGAPRAQSGIDRLKSELKELLALVADYDRYWSEGAALMNSLKMVGVVTIISFLTMGLMPINLDEPPVIFNVFHWGLLGASGSLIIVLRDLRNTDLTEVGNTEGVRELWRAILGAVLGFVASILVYGMIRGEILDGKLFPDIGAGGAVDIGLSIVVGIAAGMSFETVFERARKSSDFSA